MPQLLVCEMKNLHLLPHHSTWHQFSCHFNLVDFYKIAILVRNQNHLMLEMSLFISLQPLDVTLR
jgi:hypothetical protein